MRIGGGVGEESLIGVKKAFVLDQIFEIGVVE